MRHSTTACLLTLLALVSLSSASFASARSDLRVVDAESSLRRTRRDAAWLRQASARPATAPAVLLAAPSSDLSDQLDAWLHRERAERPVETAAPPVRTATHTPRR